MILTMNNLEKCFEGSKKENATWIAIAAVCTLKIASVKVYVIYYMVLHNSYNVDFFSYSLKT